MSIATSAIERLQDVAGRTGAVTRADERATAAELHIPLAAVHGAATFYDDLAKTRRGSRHVRVCEGTACFAADGGRHLADVERALGVSVGACREDGLVSLQQALQSDVADIQGGTTAEGIHLGAMAGTVDLVLRCLTGTRARGQVLLFDPAMPPEIRQLRFSVHYRGHRIELVFSEHRLEVTSRPGPATPITVSVREQTVELHPGTRHTFSLDSGRDAHG